MRVKAEQGHLPVAVLYDSCAAFHPVSTVVVGDALKFSLGGRVDVTAENAIHLVVAGIPNDRLLKFSDKADDVFHFRFHVGAQ